MRTENLCPSCKNSDRNRASMNWVDRCNNNFVIKKATGFLSISYGAEESPNCKRNPTKCISACRCWESQQNISFWWQGRTLSTLRHARLNALLPTLARKARQGLPTSNLTAAAIDDVRVRFCCWWCASMCGWQDAKKAPKGSLPSLGLWLGSSQRD